MSVEKERLEEIKAKAGKRSHEYAAGLPGTLLSDNATPEEIETGREIWHDGYMEAIDELLSLRTGEGDDEVALIAERFQCGETEFHKIQAYKDLEGFAIARGQQLREAKAEVERLKGERDKNFMAFTGEAMKSGVKQEFRDQQITALTTERDSLQSQLTALKSASVEEVDRVLDDHNLESDELEAKLADLARTAIQQRDERDRRIADLKKVYDNYQSVRRRGHSEYVRENGIKGESPLAELVESIESILEIVAASDGKSESEVGR